MSQISPNPLSPDYTMQARKLPPLKSLVYFEASARLQSFTAASVELNVTQGAVSRQIRQLEDFLGLDLFKRDRRHVVLTDEGHNYFVSIADVLEQLFVATEQLSANHEQGWVTLVTSSAVASMYLLPKIPAFKRAFPDIQIKIVARDNMREGLQIEHDLSLYYSRENSSVKKRVLFTEEVFPVCSPIYLRENAAELENEECRFSNLIWLESDENWINWPEWLQRMSLRITEPTSRFVLNHYSMVVQAAIAGQGVALAWEGLVDQYLVDGLLVKPTQLVLRTGAGFILDSPTGKRQSVEAETFVHWLTNNKT